MKFRSKSKSQKFLDTLTASAQPSVFNFPEMEPKTIKFRSSIDEECLFKLGISLL